jgi:hypothetical protein
MNAKGLIESLQSISLSSLTKEECIALLNMLTFTTSQVHAHLEKNHRTCAGKYWLSAPAGAGAEAGAEETPTKKQRKAPKSTRIACDGKGTFNNNVFGPPDPISGKEQTTPLCDACGIAWKRFEKKNTKKYNI